MKMLRSNLLIEPLTKEQRGALVMPDSVKDDWKRGKVIEVGEGRVTLTGNIIPSKIKKGDIVVFPPNPTSMDGNYPSIIVDGFERIILDEEYIWAIE